MFGRTKSTTEPAAPVAAPRGGINLTKGGAPVRLTKTATVTATASWSSSTDYDLYAIVVHRAGEFTYVANFGAEGVPACSKYRGVQLGADVGRAAGGAGTAEETLTISFDDSVLAVVPVAYSAQSNGSGSFRRYRVSLAVDNGAGERVTVDASNANRDDAVYTCVPAVIYNRPDGVVVEYLEAYSARGSEDRPAVKVLPDGRVEVQMDAGPRNDYK